MPTLIAEPVRIPSVGTPPKSIEEFVGRVTSQTDSVSVAHMNSPAGWSEPGQRPAFDEVTVVLNGRLRVEHRGGVVEVGAGQALIAHKDEWVRYSTPYPEGAEYIAVCVPAFSADSAHRDK